jgi:hypothetical protein
MRVWTLEEATAALPRVAPKVRRMRELVQALRDRAATIGGNGHTPSRNGATAPVTPAHELEQLAAELDDDGIVVRDPARGLIDFPARSGSGRDYLLCWLDGEDAIDWWHWPEAGFAGRTPITSPPP